MRQHFRPPSEANVPPPLGRGRSLTGPDRRGLSVRITLCRLRSAVGPKISRLPKLIRPRFVVVSTAGRTRRQTVVRCPTESGLPDREPRFALGTAPPPGPCSLELPDLRLGVVGGVSRDSNPTASRSSWCLASGRRRRNGRTDSRAPFFAFCLLLVLVWLIQGSVTVLVEPRGPGGEAVEEPDFARHLTRELDSPARSCRDPGPRHPTVIGSLTK